MMTSSLTNLNPFQMDVIKEITNIGAGNAATALADILTDRVSMSVPLLQITTIDDIAGVLGGPENEVVGVLVSMTQDLDGMLMFIFEKQITLTLLRVLLNKRINSFESIDEMDMSALKEIGNIIAGAYVSALATITDLDVRLSPPDIAIDMVGAILSYPAALFGVMGDQVLFIKEDFDSGDEQVTCHLLLLPQPDSLDLIMKRLGVE
jgi:chemotaxis protein CheC